MLPLYVDPRAPPQLALTFHSQDLVTIESLARVGLIDALLMFMDLSCFCSFANRKDIYCFTLPHMCWIDFG